MPFDAKRYPALQTDWLGRFPAVFDIDLVSYLVNVKNSRESPLCLKEKLSANHWLDLLMNAPM